MADLGPLRPDVSVSNNWDTVNGTFPGNLAAAVTQPTAPDTTANFIRSGTAGDVAEANVGTDTLPLGATVTGATLWLYASGGAKRAIGVTLKTGTTVLAGSDTNRVVAASAAEGWYSLPFTGSLTQAEIDALRVRFAIESTAGGGGAGVDTVYESYIVVHYNPAAVNHETNPADTLALSDAVALEAGVGAADSLGLADAAAIDASVGAADALDLTDAVGRDLHLTFDDTLALADDASTAVGVAHEVEPSDSLALADEATTETGRTTTHDDALDVTDASALAVTSAPQDTLNVTDDVSLASDRQVTADDGLAVQDAIALTFALTTADAIDVADAVAGAIEAAVADTLTLADAADTDLTVPGLEVNVNDDLALADALTALDLTLGVADSLVMADTIALQAALVVGDTLALDDAVLAERTGAGSYYRAYVRAARRLPAEASHEQQSDPAGIEAASAAHRTLVQAAHRED